MKLIISGATGFVARELIRQSLCRPEITSVVALARKPVSVPDGLADGADTSKLSTVIVDNYGLYSAEARREFAGAGACIWTVAVTLSKARGYEFEEVKRICQDWTLEGLKVMHESAVSKPFRFLYMSGAAAERDQTKPVQFRAEYSHMRGETENRVLAMARELDGVEAIVAKPGFVTAPGELLRTIIGTLLQWTIGIPSISVMDLATALLDQVVNGFEKDPLMPEDLARIAGSKSQGP
ncbi:putative nucleoside-diphosphate-sugar epimerase [Hypoxylon sp. NC1633]|nr:putative nucleoside-diphosphate-sugar epimerase [Hypoxylon sp. NC1633]